MVTDNEISFLRFISPRRNGTWSLSQKPTKNGVDKTNTECGVTKLGSSAKH